MPDEHFSPLGLGMIHPKAVGRWGNITENGIFLFVLEGDDTRNRIYNTVFVINLTAKKKKK